LLVLLSGCQGRGDLKGTVTYASKPVLIGAVQAVGSDGIPRTGPISEGGEYFIRDLPAGDIRLAVSSPDPGKVEYIPRKKDAPTPQPATPTTWFPIPAKYADFNSAELKFVLVSGQNTYNIKLD